MNIAIFSDSYPPTKSGVVTVVQQLQESLEALGHHVVVVTVAADDTIDDNPNIYRAKSMPIGLGMTDQYLGFPWVFKVMRFLKKHKIDIIHVHTEFSIGTVGWQAARLLKIPAVCTTHTLWEDYYAYYLPLGKHIPAEFIRSIMRNFYKKFYYLINVSSKVRKYLKNDSMIPKTPSIIIPNSLDPKKFCATKSTQEEIDSLRKNLGINKDDVMLLSVCRIGEEKRIFELLEATSNAIKKASNIKAIFLGDGPALKYSKQIAKSYGIEDKVTFTGFIDWSIVHNYYEAADIFISASLSETYSMTILEALLCGLPVVVREDESYLDRITHGVNGFLAKSDEELSEYMVKLANDAELRKLFSKECNRRSKNFLPDTFVNRHIAFYEEVIKSYPKPINEEEMQKKLDSLIDTTEDN